MLQVAQTEAICVRELPPRRDVRNTGTRTAPCTPTTDGSVTRKLLGISNSTYSHYNYCLFRPLGLWSRRVTVFRPRTRRKHME